NKSTFNPGATRKSRMAAAASCVAPTILGFGGSGSAAFRRHKARSRMRQASGCENCGGLCTLNEQTAARNAARASLRQVREWKRFSSLPAVWVKVSVGHSHDYFGHLSPFFNSSRYTE